MRAITRMACAGVAASFLVMDAAPAQPVPSGCTSERTAIAAQTLRCGGGVTIVAEDGAQFKLQDRDRNGDVDSVDLRSKALLLDAPTQRAGRRFDHLTAFARGFIASRMERSLGILRLPTRKHNHAARQGRYRPGPHGERAQVADALKRSVGPYRKHKAKRKIRQHQRKEDTLKPAGSFAQQRGHQ